MALTFLPALLAWAALNVAGLNANWQIFNAYRFVAPVDWYEVARLINSGTLEAFSFSIGDLLVRVILTVIANIHLLFGLLALFALPIVSTRSGPRRWAFVVGLVLTSVYVALVLPSLARGLYPLYAVALLLALSHFRDHRNPAPLLGLTLTAIFLLGSGANGVLELRDVQATRLPHAQGLMEELIARDVPLDETFADDFDLYLPNSDFLEMHTPGGWLNFHPEYRQSMDVHIFSGAGTTYAAMIIAADGYLENQPSYREHIEALTAERIDLGTHRLHILKRAE